MKNVVIAHPLYIVFAVNGCYKLYCVTWMCGRVDEMAKQMEEDRMMKQQHYEAEQNLLENASPYCLLPDKNAANRPGLVSRVSRSMMLNAGVEIPPMVHQDSSASLMDADTYNVKV